MPVKGNVTNKDIMSYLINTKDSGFFGTYKQSDLNNMQAIYDDLLSNFSPTRNEFVMSLYKTIGWASVDNALFNNPFGFLKKAPMRYGAYDRETFVNMLKSKDFNFYADEKELFKIYESYIMTVYHELKYRKEWAITISYDDLRDAFAEPYGLQSLINSKLAVVPASVEYWEYRAILNLINTGFNNNFFYPVTTQIPENESTARTILKLIRAYRRLVGFPNPAFNFAGAESPCPPTELILVTTPEVEASLDVDGLAVLFNVDKAQIDTRMVIVDKFDDPALIACLCDRRFFRWRDQLHTMGGFHNPDALRTNFFYHAWELISPSPFYTVIAFTTKTAGVGGIEIAESQTYTPGTETHINYTITPLDNADYTPKNYIMEITSKTTSLATQIIPGTNILYTAPDEEAENITISLTSLYDNKITTTATIAKA